MFLGVHVIEGDDHDRQQSNVPAVTPRGALGSNALDRRSGCFRRSSGVSVPGLRAGRAGGGQRAAATPHGGKCSELAVDGASARSLRCPGALSVGRPLRPLHHKPAETRGAIGTGAKSLEVAGLPRPRPRSRGASKPEKLEFWRQTA
jgi:hypothetical protein